MAAGCDESCFEVVGTVWVAGRYSFRGTDRWQIVGIFTTKAQAVAAARDKETFVGALPVDVDLGTEPTEWVGCYYPLGENPDSGTGDVDDDGGNRGGGNDP